MKINRKQIKILKTSKTSGITLIALAVTIIVIIILVGIVTSTMLNDNGIIKNVESFKLQTDYQVIKTTLETYKLKQELVSTSPKEITDESLIGTLYKKVFVTDTKRELAAIVDFTKIGINPNYGQGGEKIVKDDNGDMTTTKEVDSIYELGNIYAVDLADGELYYINGELIYSQAEKIEVAENDTIVQKYEVETLNQAYIEKRMFKTKWNVTLGEEEGSSTYSTVVLPVNNGVIYDATIYWGDGTSTLLQHRVNGIILTDEELKEKVTHNYTLSENDDGIRTIGISGIYSHFEMKDMKLKLIGLEQWGNVRIKALKFQNCTNLVGNIPAPNIEGCFSECEWFAFSFNGCSGLTGSIPKDLFKSATKAWDFIGCFQNCSGLTGSIPEGLFDTVNGKRFNACFAGCSGLTGNIPSGLFDNSTNCTSFANCFYKCSGLTGSIPQGLFDSASNCTEFSSCFEGCTGLTGTIPEGLFANKTKAINFNHCFQNCKGLIGEIPENLFENCPNTVNLFMAFTNTQINKIPANLLTKINNGENNKVTNIAGLFSGTQISEIPAGIFDKCPEVTEIGHSWEGGGLFQNCKNITILPEGLFEKCTKITNMENAFNGCTNLLNLTETFTIPSGVTNLNTTFKGCNSLEKLPDNLIIPNEVTTMVGTFKGCTSLTSLPVDFTIPENVTNMYSVLENCNNITTLPEKFTIPNTVTNMDGAFGACSNLTSLPSDFTIPEGVTSINWVFYNCKKLKGNITIRANPTGYKQCLTYTSTQSDGTLTVNYTSNCTNIDEILATGNSNYVKKGSLVD